MASRVLHLLSQRPGWTGSGIALHALVEAAGRRGWEQRVLLGTPADDPAPEVDSLPPDRIRPLLFDRPPLDFPLPGMSDVMPYRSSRWSSLQANQLDQYREAWRRHVGEALEQFQPDLIHSHHVWILSSLVKDLAGDTPVVTHCHGTGLRQLELCPHLAEEVLVGCSRNEAFLALHRGQAADLSRRLRLPPERIHAVGSGYLEQIFHARGRPATDTRNVLYAGKLSGAKGLPWLVEAVERVAGQVPNLRLHVAGSGAGEEADTIRARLEASPCTIFHGQVDQPRLAELMRESSVFVLPSFYEGLPLVLVEAAACGCRLVATRLPGVVDELAPLLGDSLELVPLPRLRSIDRPVPEDLEAFVEKLADALERSLRRPPLRHADELVGEMTWDAVFERVERVWRQLLAGGRSDLPGTNTTR